MLQSVTYCCWLFQAVKDSYSLFSNVASCYRIVYTVAMYTVYCILYTVYCCNDSQAPAAMHKKSVVYQFEEEKKYSKYWVLSIPKILPQPFDKSLLTQDCSIVQVYTNLQTFIELFYVLGISQPPLLFPLILLLPTLFPPSPVPGLLHIPSHIQHGMKLNNKNIQFCPT